MAFGDVWADGELSDDFIFEYQVIDGEVHDFGESDAGSECELVDCDPEGGCAAGVGDQLLCSVEREGFDWFASDRWWWSVHCVVLLVWDLRQDLVMVMGIASVVKCIMACCRWRVWLVCDPGCQGGLACFGEKASRGGWVGWWGGSGGDGCR